MSELEQIVFQLITLSGSARSSAFGALEHAKKFEFDKAEEQLKHARQEIVEAHNIQTDLIQKESKGDNTDVNLLMVHAQDHLMTAMLAKDLIEQMVQMQKALSDKL